MPSGCDAVKNGLRSVSRSGALTPHRRPDCAAAENRRPAVRRSLIGSRAARLKLFTSRTRCRFSRSTYIGEIRTDHDGTLSTRPILRNLAQPTPSPAADTSIAPQCRHDTAAPARYRPVASSLSSALSAGRQRRQQPDRTVQRGAAENIESQC